MLYAQFFFFNSSFSNNTIFLLRHCVGMDDPEQGSLESGVCSYPRQGFNTVWGGFYVLLEDTRIVYVLG